MGELHLRARTRQGRHLRERTPRPRGARRPDPHGARLRADAPRRAHDVRVHARRQPRAGRTGSASCSNGFGLWHPPRPTARRRAWLPRRPRDNRRRRTRRVLRTPDPPAVRARRASSPHRRGAHPGVHLAREWDALRDLAARRASPVQVVTGVEVTTRSGHLLALWIEDEIPMLCSLAEAIARVHRAGGLAVVPHPLSYLTFSIGEGALRQLARSHDREGMVDAVELRNPSYAGRVRARRAAWLNANVVRAAETGSSDAHHAALVGTCWTDFEGRTADDLRRAIVERTTRADGRRWSLREHLDGAARQQWRSMVRDPIKRVRRRMTTSKKTQR